MYLPDLEAKVLNVFEDDGYRVVDWPREGLALGDLATYWDSTKSRKGFWHVGIVCEIREGPAGSPQQTPFILSKWDDASGEVFHHFRDCPFARAIQPEFWTDRSLERIGR